MAKKRKTATIDFPFYQYLQLFVRSEHRKVYAAFKPLSKKFLNFNNPKENAKAYLRVPQFEALEMYVFLKEFCENEKLWQIFNEWYTKTGKFEGRTTAGVEKSGQLSMFDVTEIGQDETKGYFQQIFDQIKAMEQDYPNYIFALTMGLGKTVLMATSIFYEFLLANKYPRTPLYCHNALVFAPDKTVLESLREIQTFDKSKVVPAEYLSWLDANLKFHFLDDTSTQLSTIDNSMYNIIITNSQKIILKKEHKQKSAAQTLFGEETGKYTALSLMSKFAALGEEAGIEDIENEIQLIDNHRFTKLSRLKQLGIYVDEAHHVFGNKLSEDLMTTSKTTSLRVTINELAASLAQAGSRVVACYNYTGTPYVKNRLLPEVVYAYGLREAIDHEYLKKVLPFAYENIRENVQAFCRASITDFWEKCGEKRVENMLPKMAFFASSIEEATHELRPAIEAELIRLGIPTSRILVNVGDTTVTSNDDLREFNNLDTPRSEKQFIILVGKGKEGWNCRSLFAVAMYRRAKSTVFVLQATMRCLRQIGDYQHTAYLYFSNENMDILNNELKENFNISLDDMAGTNDSNIAEVRLVPPPIKVTVKKIRKLYQMKKKTLANNLDLQLETVDVEKYRIKKTRRSIDNLSTVVGHAEDISEVKDQRHFSPFTLVAEIARYLQMSPVEIKGIMSSAKESLEDVCTRVNEFNELLYDEVIPRLFKELYDIVEFKHEEDQVLELVKDPKEKGMDFYQVKYKHGLLASYNSDEYKDYREKSFNVDNYCFDSKPEIEMFWTLLKDERLTKVWFTGMLTAGQTDFAINYIDPESNAVRSYYPDFLIQKKDGSYVIIEVKGDHMIDDAVVQAKKEYAQQIASSSKMEYVIVPGTKAKQRLVL
ncbi:type III restriction endonuclease [Prevotella sp. P4-67]|uniref:TnsA endonuclease N-terminal domain-containing protein n=1 Tax=Prevotella sp. P4-67 TaxID=2024227 RepID=UPI000B97404B|nr:TnsA endonuclease N-terminal domain-containing protein [Prevotella sp. P4-67]OYP70638.1 type III restriction endonuclease [Prevotella sp. P4-67]